MKENGKKIQRKWQENSKISLNFDPLGNPLEEKEEEKKKKDSSVWTSKRILLVEPHADDIFLSMGGFCLSRLREENIYLCTVTSPSKYNEEDSAKLKKYFPNWHFKNLGFSDILFRSSEVKSLREKFGEEYTISQAFSEYNPKDKIERLKNSILELNPDILFIPLGIQHPMHVLVHDTLKKLTKKTFCYGDLPYIIKNMNFMQKNIRCAYWNRIFPFFLSQEMMKEKIEIFSEIYAKQFFYFMNLLSENFCEIFYKGENEDESSFFNFSEKNKILCCSLKEQRK